MYFNDKAPSQYSIIQQGETSGDSILLYSNDTLIGQVGGMIVEDLTSVYIPTKQLAKTWEMIEKIILHLIDAGYPGCIGCGGPGAEEIWDENKNREYILKFSK